MSQRIAPAVKSLVIRCGTGQEIDPEMHELVEEEKVVDSLFHVLQHLPNIKAFFAEGVTLAEVHFEQLLQLPYLIGMHLDTCSAPGDLRLSRFKMKHLSLHGEMSGTFGWWIPLLRSDALVHLSYDSRKQVKPEEPEELVLPAIATGPLMNHLRGSLLIRLDFHALSLHCPGALP
ncbi:hypothetical protein PHLCEN_2v2479 [Hermanssonia centrifuga]|uniref:Uncharacterized protein n=1 Tax=Hermanssonia centrifuga TaxID=98765 RepID=A0A2R6RLT4_9APHY|nr:hypothetical protein PHLCEN_2v2479 [Hermanssonia centrifuga]